MIQGLLPSDEGSSLQAVRELLASRSEVRLAVVFGSVARNQQRRDSDLDILLHLDPDDDPIRRTIEHALADTVKRQLQVVYAHEAPPLLRFQIARDGVLLAEQPPGEWVRFKAKAMVDWWDWAPLARQIDDAAIQRLRAEVALGRS